MLTLREKYLRGYERYPETQEEIAAAGAIVHLTLEECPWDDDADQDVEQ